MKWMEAIRAAPRASDEPIGTIARRAAARVAPHRVVPIRAGLRRELRVHAEPLGDAAMMPSDADIAGLFARALNAGIHDEPDGQHGAASDDEAGRSRAMTGGDGR